MGDIETSTGEKKKIHVALPAGANLTQTMSTPRVWVKEDLRRMLGVYGTFMVGRNGTSIGIVFTVSHFVFAKLNPKQVAMK